MVENENLPGSWREKVAAYSEFNTTSNGTRYPLNIGVDNTVDGRVCEGIECLGAQIEVREGSVAHSSIRALINNCYNNRSSVRACDLIASATISGVIENKHRARSN